MNERGADIAAAYDLSTWDGPDTFQAGTARLADELADAMAEESADHRTLRDELLTRMNEIRDDVRAKDAGVYAINLAQIERVQRSLLCGGAAATGGYSSAHESPRLGVAQVGVCLTQYDGGGGGGGWGMRLYRKSQPIPGDPKEQALALLEDQARRQAREAMRHDEPVDGNVAELTRRGIATFAERAVLLDKATAAWRFGRGPLAPLQLLTGGGGEALRQGVTILRRFVESHPRFAFVSFPNGEPVMETIGGGLRAGEFALVKTDRDRLVQMVNGMSFRGGDRTAGRGLRGRDRPARDVRRLPRHATRAAAGVLGASRPHEAGGGGADVRRGSAALLEPAFIDRPRASQRRGRLRRRWLGGERDRRPRPARDALSVDVQAYAL